MKKIKLFFLLLITTSIFVGQEKIIQTDFSPQAKAAAKAQIEKYRERVIKGEKMKDLAVLYSEDPGSAKNGGMYYGVKKGIMDPAFEAVAFSLKPGQVSQVFETTYGYHFIQLVQRRGDVLDLRHILIIPKEAKK